MRRLKLAPVLLLMLGIVVIVGAGPSSAARTSTGNVTITPAPAYTGAQLSAYAGDDWPVVGGDLQNDRYSTLTQITSSNVTQLQQVWQINMSDCQNYQAVHAALAPGVPAVCPGEEENPVVIGGVMYVADALSDVYAYDATNGNLLWQYTPTFSPGYSINGGGRQPGVSVGQGLVFLGQPRREGRRAEPAQRAGCLDGRGRAVAEGHVAVRDTDLLRRRSDRGHDRRRRRRREQHHAGLQRHQR